MPLLVQMDVTTATTTTGLFSNLWLLDVDECLVCSISEAGSVPRDVSQQMRGADTPKVTVCKQAKTERQFRPSYSTDTISGFFSPRRRWTHNYLLLSRSAGINEWLSILKSGQKSIAATLGTMN